MRPRAVLVAVGWAIAFAVSAAPVGAATTLTVDTVEDSYDGTCSDDCSLRDALASVEDGGTVRVPAGFYDLSLVGDGGVGAGDLDVDRSVTVVGTGSLGAFIDGGHLNDRIFDLTADVTIEHLTLLGGPDGAAAGGLVRAAEGSSRIVGSTLVGGIARRGGAVAVGDGAALTIVRSWVSPSSASGRGGALFVRGDATVVRSTISDAQAGAGGGAWVGRTGSLEIVDSTISGNEAIRGGGGLNVHGMAEVRSSTVARNRATVGGGISATVEAGVTLGSSILDGNVVSLRGSACSRELATAGHNVVDRLGCGLAGSGDLVGLDPLLGPLRQNGGPTPTHAMHRRSPALGNGGPGCSPLDQRGAPRHDCDSGAYEIVLCLGHPVTIVGTPGDDDLSGGLKPDVFLGRGGDDVFQGSLGNDRACGGPGDDHLIGGPGDDRLAGEAGDDVLDGEGGDDRLLGGPGRDVCRGGPGRDVIRNC